MRAMTTRRSPKISVRRGFRIPVRTGPSAMSFCNVDGPRHVGMDFAVILHNFGSFHNDTFGGVYRDSDVPGAVARRRRMGEEIRIDPCDGVADMRRDALRRKGKVLNLDPDG